MSTNEPEVIFTCECAGDLGARVGGYTAALLFEQPDGSFTVHDVYEGGPHHTFTSFSSALDKMVAIAQSTYAVMQKRLERDRLMNVVIDHVIEEFETLPTANTNIMNDEDVVEYLNKKYNNFKGVELKQFVETHRAEFMADSFKYTNAVHRLRGIK